MMQSSSNLDVGRGPARLTQAELERQLDRAVVLLKSRFDTPTALQALFDLVLYKWLCDLHEGKTARTPTHRVPVGARWSDLLHRRASLGVQLSRSLQTVEQLDPRFAGIFGDVDYSDEDRWPDDLLRELLPLFGCLGPTAVDPDMLVTACEASRERATDAATRDAGGFVTPPAVARLMVTLIDPKAGENIYDPVCGSAGMFVAAYRHVETQGGAPSRLGLFGQERLGTMTRISLLLHGIDHATIVRNDSLVEPHFLGRYRFDVTFGNPPFSLPWRDEHWEYVALRPEFQRYGQPPRNRCDFAFLLHMLGSLTEDGRMAVILPHGALYRLGAENDIRRGILQDDLVEAVIDLGPGLFLFTATPVVLLLLRRRKSTERRGKLLLVRHEPDSRTGRRRPELSDERAARIQSAVRCYTDIPGFSRVITIHEVASQGYNLSLPLYFEAGNTLLPPVSAGGPDLIIARSGEGALADEVHEAERALEEARQVRASRELLLLTRGLTNARPRHVDFGDFPASWDVVTLTELGADLRDGTVAPKPSTIPVRAGQLELTRTSQKLAVAVRYIRQTQLSPDGDVDIEAAEVVDIDPDALARFAVHPGDVLLRRMHGSLCGKAVLVDVVPMPAVFAAGITRIRVDHGAIDPLLLLCWLHHPPIRANLIARESRGVQRSVNHRALHELVYPRVPEDERPAARRRLADAAPHRDSGSPAPRRAKRAVPRTWRKAFKRAQTAFQAGLWMSFALRPSTSSIRRATGDPSSHSRTSWISIDVWMC